MIKWTFGSSSVQVDMTIAQSLKEKLNKLNGARVEVGIFSAFGGRKSLRGDLTNAQLGAIHEFGVPSKRIPERSWLRFPLMTRLFGAVKNTDWIEIILRKGIANALGLLGVKAELVIHDAFRTGGWGWWKNLKARTIRRKGHARILIETGQMEKAVSSRVVLP